MNREVRLSDDGFHIMRYVTPVLLVFGIVIPTLQEQKEFPWFAILYVVGTVSVAWIYSLCFKRVKLEGEQLYVVDEFKSDFIHIDDIQSIKINGLPFRSIVIKTRSKSTFGNRFRFYPNSNASFFSISINADVISVLEEIKSRLEESTSQD